jgi:hypothetical protein
VWDLRGRVPCAVTIPFCQPVLAGITMATAVASRGHSVSTAHGCPMHGCLPASMSLLGDLI